MYSHNKTYGNYVAYIWFTIVHSLLERASVKELQLQVEVLTYLK